MEAVVNTQPRVLAVVVTYNAMRWADRCLGSLLRSSLKPAVLVVDNGSSDGTREHVRSAFPEVRLECRPENPGFGAANNIGLRMALEEGFDFVYLMNQDAWVEEDTLELLAAAHRPEFGVLSPVQNTAEGAPDANFQRWCGSSLRRAGAQPGKTSMDAVPGIVEVPFVMAAHWLVSRGALRKVGGFSPAFRQYGEDDRLQLRRRARRVRGPRPFRQEPAEGREDAAQVRGAGGEAQQSRRLPAAAPSRRTAGTGGHEREEPVGISAEADSRAAAALSGAHQAACGFEGGGGFPLISVRKFLNSLP